MYSVKSFAACMGILVTGAVTIQVQGQSPGRTVLDGAYTQAQAVRGKAAYEANCARCHRESLEGNAEALSLTGTRFMESWRDDTLEGVFTHMKTRMPRRPGGEPGSLSETTYLDILAYILQVNGYVPGSGELTADSVKTTLLVGKEGPKPLPTNALVQAVGCLMPGPDDTWLLANATEVTRTQDAEAIAADEVTTAASRPLGTQTIGLRNVPDFKAGFSPETFKGQKVLAKGALIRQTNAIRIYVTSLQSAAPVCAK